MTRYIPIGDVEFRLDMIARALGIPAATLDKLASGEWVAVPVDDRRVDELAMIVRRLVHRGRKGLQINTMLDQAEDYLRRHDLQGSPLRQECAATEAASHE